MAESTKKYTDLDLEFLPHPVTGDITKKKDVAAVMTSVRNLLLTSFYERPFQPAIGSNLRRMLFEPIDRLTSLQIRDEIKNVVSNFEPRVNLQGIVVDPDYDRQRYDVTLTFFIVSNPDPITINLFLERVR
jgi:phage baseplate assembly protein W